MTQINTNRKGILLITEKITGEGIRRMFLASNSHRDYRKELMYLVELDKTIDRKLKIHELYVGS